jgi:hypothetical protein
MAQFARLAFLLAPLLAVATVAWAGQAEPSQPEPQLPEAPQPQIPVSKGKKMAEPCPAAAGATPANASPATRPDSSGKPAGANNQPGSPSGATTCRPQPVTNWYSRFLNGPQVKPLTPREKGWLAIRNVVDPFNVITVLGSSAIAVGSDADSPYGPGMPGFGRYVGVSFTQDMTGEFFATFLISSIVHQDPHYHRMPSASMKRRIAHAIYQVVWTQGDNGKGMVNYANLAGAAVSDEISNLYVPGRKTNLPASAERYGTGLASAPIDNFVSEFLPDVARHIHVQIVVIQRIINQVAKTEASGPS